MLVNVDGVHVLQQHELSLLQNVCASQILTQTQKGLPNPLSLYL